MQIHQKFFPDLARADAPQQKTKEMDTEGFKEKLGDLGGNIDDLEEALKPLLSQDLSDTTSKLPLLDKAKLNVLTTYAIESLLFSILKLQGTDTKSHPVFTELARVKQYFAKLEAAESGNASTKGTPSMALDKAAANRFIKHALSANNPKGSPKNPTKIKFDDHEVRAVSTKKRKPEQLAGDDASSSSSSSSGASSSESEAEAEAETHPEPEQRSKRSSQPKAKPHQSEGAETSSIQQEKPRTAKLKSSRPPRDSKAVFQDLLARPRKKVKDKNGK